MVTKKNVLRTCQPAITCSKLTIATLEQDVKHVQSNNKDTRTTTMTFINAIKINAE